MPNSHARIHAAHRFALFAFAGLVLASCGGGGGGGPPPPPALMLAAPSPSVGAGASISLTATGGQTPYTFSIVSGGGSVDGTGLFTAPATAGTAVVQVTDKASATAKTSLQIIAVQFVNATAIVDSATVTTQNATGGAPPYTYQVAVGGGGIDSSGKYTSPTGPATATLIVTDSKGASAQESVTVNAPLVANHSAATIGGGTTVLVGAVGGQAPFTYNVTSGGGSVDASGHFTAATTPGTSVVSITDALGSSTLVTITVNPPLSITPASATLAASSSQTTRFMGMNGIPPYSYSLISGAGAITAQGLYTVGSVSGTTTVQVTDGQGTSATAQVRALRIRINGAVFASAADSSNLYVGGRFSAVNPYSAPHLAIVDQATGNLNTGCDLGTGFLDGYVSAIVTIGNAIYVAGEFSQYRGAIVGKLAKIDATTCALDPVFSGGGGFGANPGETVYSIAASGSSLYVVGNVSSYRGVAINGIVKLDLTTGSADPVFAPARADGNADAIVTSGTSVYVGGYFQHFAGVAAAQIAKLNAATGAVDTTFTAAPGSDGPVASLAISGNQLYVGGSFTHYAGVPTALARVDATSGALDTSFTQSVGNAAQVSVLLVSGNSLYVARQFPGATPVLEMIDTSTGNANAAFSAGAGFDFGVSSLLLANSSLYVGGAFTSYRGTPAFNLAKINPTSGALDTTFTQATGGNATVYALAIAGSQIIAGGSLSTYRGAPASNIAKFSLATDAPDLAFSSTAAPNSNVITMKLNGAALYIGGIFTSCGGFNSYLVAKIDAATGACDPVFAAGGGAPFPVSAMLIHGNSLYLGGGSAVANLAKMDLLTGHVDPAFLAHGFADGQVNSLADSPTAIYAGGEFQNYGGLPAQGLVKLDPSTGALDQTFTQPTGVAPGTDGGPAYVFALLLANNSLYVGGAFQTYRGNSAQGLLKLDPVSGALDTTFSHSTGFVGASESLISTGSSIIVAGSFLSYRGGPTSNLVRLDASNGNFDPTFTTQLPCDSCNVNMDSLTIVGSKLFVGEDAPTLYRGVPTYGDFPVDLATGQPTDP